MTLFKAKAFVAFTMAQVIVLVVMVLWGASTAGARTDAEIPVKRELVKRLELTDLAIWTEARYTRHPTQADNFAPFQDGPSALEHFPAGSVVAAPERATSDGTDR
ncbi:MAG: hypothetical protein P8127_02895 [Acidobacteriota bacterium]|jgi:hypothetical protein